MLSLPLALLAKTKFSLRQKLSAGVVLCLSIVMIAIGMLRGISARIHGTSDQIWTMFWIQIESAIAVIMVNITAFRQFFLSVAGASNERRAQRQRWADYRKLWRIRESRRPVLPEVPVGATMTGMRTMIRVNGTDEVGNVGGMSREQSTMASSVHRVASSEPLV